MQRLEALASTLDVASWHVIRDEPSGLRALIILDDTTLGPAAGGVRTRRYADEADAVAECAGLARAMTVKCAISGLDAGGGKTVVLDHAAMDRPRAFEALGRAVQSLKGRYLTAGDLGTAGDDLEAMARCTEYVRTDEAHLGAAVGRGLVRCVEACVQLRSGAGHAERSISLDGLVVAIQGCGAMGAAAATELRQRGCRLLLADLDDGRARRVAEAVQGTVVPASSILASPCDVLAPCAAGGVIDVSEADTVAAFAVCGAANNILAGPAAERRLRERGVVFVPDSLSSAGAVIEGVGETIMGLSDREGLIDRLRETTVDVLRRALAAGTTGSEVVARLASERIAAHGGGR